MFGTSFKPHNIIPEKLNVKNNYDEIMDIISDLDAPFREEFFTDYVEFYSIKDIKRINALMRQKKC